MSSTLADDVLRERLQRLRGQPPELPSLPLPVWSPAPEITRIGEALSLSRTRDGALRAGRTSQTPQSLSRFVLSGGLASRHEPGAFTEGLAQGGGIATPMRVVGSDAAASMLLATGRSGSGGPVLVPPLGLHSALSKGEAPPVSELRRGSLTSPEVQARVKKVGGSKMTLQSLANHFTFPFNAVAEPRFAYADEEDRLYRVKLMPATEQPLRTSRSTARSAAASPTGAAPGSGRASSARSRSNISAGARAGVRALERSAARYDAAATGPRWLSRKYREGTGSPQPRGRADSPASEAVGAGGGSTASKAVGRGTEGRERGGAAVAFGSSASGGVQAERGDDGITGVAADFDSDAPGAAAQAGMGADLLRWTPARVLASTGGIAAMLQHLQHQHRDAEADEDSEGEEAAQDAAAALQSRRSRMQQQQQAAAASDARRPGSASLTGHTGRSGASGASALHGHAGASASAVGHEEHVASLAAPVRSGPKPVYVGVKFGASRAGAELTLQDRFWTAQREVLRSPGPLLAVSASEVRTMQADFVVKMPVRQLWRDVAAADAFPADALDSSRSLLSQATSRTVLAPRAVPAGAGAHGGSRPPAAAAAAPVSLTPERMRGGAPLNPLRPSTPEATAAHPRAAGSTAAALRVRSMHAMVRAEEEAERLILSDAVARMCANIALLMYWTVLLPRYQQLSSALAGLGADSERALLATAEAGFVRYRGDSDGDASSQVPEGFADATKGHIGVDLTASIALQQRTGKAAGGAGAVPGATLSMQQAHAPSTAHPRGLVGFAQLELSGGSAALNEALHLPGLDRERLVADITTDFMQVDMLLSARSGTGNTHTRPVLLLAVRAIVEAYLRLHFPFHFLLEAALSAYLRRHVPRPDLHGLAVSQRHRQEQEALPRRRHSAGAALRRSSSGAIMVEGASTGASYCNAAGCEEGAASKPRGEMGNEGSVSTPPPSSSLHRRPSVQETRATTETIMSALLCWVPTISMLDSLVASLLDVTRYGSHLASLESAAGAQRALQLARKELRRQRVVSHLVRNFLAAPPGVGPLRQVDAAVEEEQSRSSSSPSLALTSPSLSPQRRSGVGDGGSGDLEHSASHIASVGESRSRLGSLRELGCVWRPTSAPPADTLAVRSPVKPPPTNPSEHTAAAPSLPLPVLSLPATTRDAQHRQQGAPALHRSTEHRQALGQLNLAFAAVAPTPVGPAAQVGREASPARSLGSPALHSATAAVAMVPAMPYAAHAREVFHTTSTPLRSVYFDSAAPSTRKFLRQAAESLPAIPEAVLTVLAAEAASASVAQRQHANVPGASAVQMLCTLSSASLPPNDAEPPPAAGKGPSKAVSQPEAPMTHSVMHLSDPIIRAQVERGLVQRLVHRYVQVDRQRLSPSLKEALLHIAGLPSAATQPAILPRSRLLEPREDQVLRAFVKATGEGDPLDPGLWALLTGRPSAALESALEDQVEEERASRLRHLKAETEAFLEQLHTTATLASSPFDLPAGVAASVPAQRGTLLAVKSLPSAPSARPLAAAAEPATGMALRRTSVADVLHGVHQIRDLARAVDTPTAPPADDSRGAATADAPLRAPSTTSLALPATALPLPSSPLKSPLHKATVRSPACVSVPVRAPLTRAALDLASDRQFLPPVAAKPVSQAPQNSTQIYSAVLTRESLGLQVESTWLTRVKARLTATQVSWALDAEGGEL